jgi:apolipoprotein N-acyltransferase
VNQPMFRNTWVNHPWAIRVLGAVLSGALLRLAFPAPGIGWMVLPAVALLLASIKGTTARGASSLTMLHAAVFYLSLLPWLRVIGVDAWLLLSLVCILWSGLLGALLSQALRRRAWIAWTALAWVGVEYLRSSIPFGGFSWGRLAFAEPWALVGLVRVVGAPGLTASIVVLAGLLLVVVGRLYAMSQVDARVSEHLRDIGVVSGLSGIILVSLIAPSLAIANPQGESIPVAVIQGNVPRLGLDFNAQRRAVLDNHVQVTRQLALDVDQGLVQRPRFVIWPENASDIDPLRDESARQVIDAAVAAIGVPVLVGAVLDNGDGTLSNSGIVWDPMAGPGEQYSKRHLVPFGEYVPGRALLARFISRFDRVSRDFVPGPQAGNVVLAGSQVGAVMCFEVAYDDSMRDIARDSEFLVVQTNNATYGLSGQPLQQLAITRVRAIEHGRTVLVAATTGISGIIRPDGSMAAREVLPEFSQGYVVADVVGGPGVSPGSSLGAIPERATLVALLFLVIPRKRRGSIESVAGEGFRAESTEVTRR